MLLTIEPNEKLYLARLLKNLFEADDLVKAIYDELSKILLSSAICPLKSLSDLLLCKISLSLNSKILWPSLIKPLFNLRPVLKNNLPSCLSLKLETCKILKEIFYEYMISFQKRDLLVKLFSDNSPSWTEYVVWLEFIVISLLLLLKVTLLPGTKLTELNK